MRTAFAGTRPAPGTETGSSYTSRTSIESRLPSAAARVEAAVVLMATPPERRKKAAVIVRAVGDAVVALPSNRQFVQRFHTCASSPLIELGDFFDGHAGTGPGRPEGWGWCRR